MGKRGQRCLSLAVSGMNFNPRTGQPAARLLSGLVTDSCGLCLQFCACRRLVCML